MRDVNSSNKINNFEIARNFSMKLWMERKEKGPEEPDPIEATSFWRKIWLEEVSHNERASWLEEAGQEFSTIEVQEDINITIEDIRTGVSKMANWKAAGPDLVQGYWFKKLPGLHARLQLHLQDCVNLGNVPEWTAKGRTVLIQKDAMKGTQANNYRPITCLPIMWKLLTGVMETSCTSTWRGMEC